MRIFVGTDFHGFRPSFEASASEAKARNADIIVICGDLTNFGTVKEAEDLLLLIAKPGIPVLFVPGNCDPPSLVNLNLDGVRCIHGVGVTYSGVTFLGVGGSSITPFNTFFEMDEEEIADILRGCLNNLDVKLDSSQMILVSHSPPKDTKLDKTPFGKHVGSVSIRRFIEEHGLFLVVCGHIHEAKGTDSVNSTLVVNPGSAKQGNYAIICIEGKRVNIELQSLKI